MTKSKISKKICASFTNIVAVFIIVFMALFMLDMWVWFEKNHNELSNQSAGVFGSLVLLIGGSLKLALDKILETLDDD